MNRFLIPGALFWSALALGTSFSGGPLGLLELLFLLAPWVIVPLGLSFVPESLSIRLARRLQPAAALLTTVSFFLPRGLPAAALATPWLGVTALAAWGGLLGLKAAFRGGVPPLLVTAALLFPPIGSVHLISSRLGYALAGFPEPIILLTAIHFHYTAFAAPILAALAARALEGRWGLLARASGLGLVGGTPLLAAGFIFSPRLKAVAVGVLTLSVMGVAAAQAAARTRLPSRGARLLLLVSSAAVLAGMALAAIYEHGFYSGRSWLSIREMAWSHGLLNGLGFSLLGLLGWHRSGAAGSGKDLRGGP